MKIPVEFASQGETVRGTLYLTGRDSSLATVLLLGGFPDDNEEDVLALGERMLQQGINALTFNYRGTHRNGGIFSFANTLQDIEAASDYLRKDERVADPYRIRADWLVLVGLSYGGGLALAYAARHPEIRHVVSIAGTDHGELIRAYRRDPSFAHRLDAWFEKLGFPAGPIHFHGRAALQEELLRNPDPYDLRLNAPALADRNILMIGGWDDLWITLEDHLLPLYRALVAAGARQVELTAVRDDHNFLQSQEEVARIIV
jgi:pimeloyl-ACP methyl ester carboxylesterase